MKGVVALAAAFVAAVAPTIASAELSQAHLRRLLRAKIEAAEELAASSLVVAAVKRHNARKLSLEKIKELDREWTATSHLTPLKREVLDNPVAKHFRSLVTFEDTIYSELFLTGNQGATIAAYPLTTDYWQGDEDKWIKAYNGGAGQVFVGPVRYDESTKTDSVQISVPVLDGERAIGVLVVGIKLSYVQAKYLKERRGH
ncbi:MAG: hypothetical protein D6815_09545 [Candidatus Dadabacteria bacterium]|nr:MAG: hypothetical protein D6815_09545 [Candidatus Dadabacteria bacterium]